MMKTHRHLFVTCILAIVFSALLMGCQESQTPPEESNQDPKTLEVLLEGDDVVLAKVNGSAITGYDLEMAITTTLGEQSAARLDDSGRRKVLESLVAARAIAQNQEATLTFEERAVLGKKVAAYEEQLLVKQYLAVNASPEPVTQEMVRGYYNAHPERFGGKTIRRYEMITSDRKLKSAERDRLMTALTGPAEKADWGQWVNMLQQQGHPVVYRQGQAAEKALNPRLRQVMGNLKKDEASNLVFIQGDVYVVRILEEQTIAPRPLSEVSAQIRKALLPVQLKKAVKQASEKVLATTDVVYEQNNQK
jgi:hypothetical protein